MNKLALVIIFFAAPALAAPANYTLTFNSLTVPTGLQPDAWRLHETCDEPAQTMGAVVLDPLSAGNQYQWLGDTALTYTFCAVGYNAFGVGPFVNVATIPPINVPGGTVIDVVCDTQLVAGGSAVCTVTMSP